MSNDVNAIENNKHSCLCDQYGNELKEIKNQITRLQKSVANLRIDILEVVAKTILEAKPKRI